MKNSLVTKAKQDATFTLVKSLSKSEKRTFRILASMYKNTGSDYMHLFDYMDKRETYDEEAAKKHFSQKLFSTFFASKKKHLYYKIMESLRKHYDDKIDQLGFYTTLRNVQILSEKGLKKLSEKEVHKLCSIADKHDLVVEKVIAYNCLLKTLKSDYSPEGWQQQLASFEQMAKNVAQLADFTEYTHHFRCLRHDHITKNKAYFNELKDFRASVPTLLQSSNISFANKFTLLQANRFGEMVAGINQSEKLQLDIQIAELWRQHPNIIIAHPFSFIVTYQALLMNALLLGETSIHDKYIKIFNDLANANKLQKHASISVRYALFRSNYNIQILSLSQRKNYLAIWQLGKEYRKLLSKYINRVNDLNYFMDLINLLKTGFLSKQYTESTLLAQELLYRWQVERLQPRYYATVTCILLLCMYEDNYKYLYGQIQKHKRKMEEYDTYDTVAKYTILMLRKLVGKKHTGKEHLVFKHYHKLLQEYALQTNNINKTRYAYLEAWLQLKINTTVPNNSAVV